MPYKECPQCHKKHGVRTKYCGECAHVFQPKDPDAPRESKPKPKVEEPPFDISTLAKGDIIKVKGGPYHEVQEEGGPRRISMGERGKFTVISVRDNQIYAYSLKEGNVHIYMGPKCEGKYINHMRPHKIKMVKKYVVG